MIPLRPLLAAAAALLAGECARSQSLEFGPPYTVTGGFQNPFGVAVNRTQGHLLVSDTRNRQVRWTTLASLSGTPTFQSFGYVADATQAEALLDPQGIAADAAGHVYVVDARRNQVNLYTWNAATSTYAYDANFASTTRNSVAGVNIQSPRDVAVGPDGKVYLLDSGNSRILRADGASDTSWEVSLTDATLHNPYGLDVGPDGRLYVADTDNHRIVRYNASGTPTAFGRFGTGPAQFRYPRDVAADVDGRMYVVDSYNHRLEVLDQNGAHLLGIGKAPTFAAVQKIAMDADRHLYLSDSDRDAVLAFLGRDVPVPFDGWIRDYVGDTGAQPSDPAFTLASPDILVRHNPDVNMATATASGLESIAFEHPRYDRDNYVYIAVRNRGTQEFRDGVAKVYWGDPAGALNFPADWKDSGLFNGTSASSAGNALPIPPVAPGGVVVLGPLRFRPPAPETAGLGNGTFVVGVRLVHPYDVAPAGGGPAAVRASNDVAIRTVHVVRGPFPTGDQNTLVVRVRYSDDPTPIDEATLTSRITQVGNWTNEVSWTTASVHPLFRGEITLPQTRSYYQDPSRNLLVEMATDALNVLLTTEPTLLDGVSASPADDIGRLILVTNDTSVDVDWATTGPWPYHTPAGDRYLTVSVQGMNNSAAAFEHGLSHQFSLLDLFAYPNVSFPRPFADGWDNMAKPFNGVHPTVWSKSLASWVTERGANIVFIPRPARATSYSTGSTPIPLYRQATAAAGQNVAIALGLTPGVGTFTDETAFYYLEARTNGAANADAALPGSGVLMYYVNSRIPQGQGPIILRDHGTSTPGLEDAALADGQSETPPGTGITATAHTGPAGGADWLIDINYTPPPTGYDVWITTGDPGWTSPDIWVDNQSDGYDVESGRTPTDRGDTAIGGEENRIYARVHNAGPADAHDVEVAFFISEPYHTVGGEADFTFLKSKVIAHLPPGETTEYVTWTPTVHDPHTCVKVVLRRLLDDTNGANNSAQQNLAVEWSTSASPYKRVDFSFQVTNPDNARKLVYFRADRVPATWTRQLLPEKAYLLAQQRFTGTLRVTPPPEEKNCKRHDIYVTAWTPAGDTLTRIGGTTVSVNLAKAADLRVTTDVESCTAKDYGSTQTHRTENQQQCARIVIKGCTDPRQPNTEVIVRYKDPAGNPVYRTVKTDANGCFDDFYVATSGGDWEATATIPAGHCYPPITGGGTVEVGTTGEEPGTPLRVTPARFKVKAELKMRAKGTQRCGECRRRDTEHDFVARLAGLGGAVDGTLHVSHLKTALAGSDDTHAPHSGAARLQFADDTLVLGEVHGVTNVLASLYPGADGKFRLDGQFTGLVVEGNRRGCRLTLEYAIELGDNLVQGGASGSGLADGVWTCSCQNVQPTQPPEPKPLPTGCVYPVSARGEGRIVETSSTRTDCLETHAVLITKSRIDGAMAPRTPTATLAARYVDGQIRIEPFGQTYANSATSPALHGAPFEMEGKRGDRIRGRVFGLTNMEPHRPTAASTAPLPYLLGTLVGKVESGPLEGCELRGLYGMSYPAGSSLQKTSLGWVMEGAIVCDCKSGTPSREREAEAAKPAVRQPVAARAAVEAALTARFGRAEDLEPAMRTLADVNRDGKTAPDEVASLKMAREVFRKLDANHDGVLTAEEFVAGAGESLAAMMAALDRNHNGVLEADEMQTVPLAARRHADRNRDGKLDREELLAWLREGRKAQFAGFKRDPNGRVTFREYFLGMPQMHMSGGL